MLDPSKRRGDQGPMLGLIAHRLPGGWLVRNHATALHLVLVLSLGLSGLLGVWPQTFAVAKKSSHAAQHHRQGNDGGHGQLAGKHKQSDNKGAGHHKGQQRQGQESTKGGHPNSTSAHEDSPCGDLEKAPQSVGEGCSHGPDPAPPGFNAERSVKPLSAQSARIQASAISCDGDGQSGYRVQVLYVHSADVASRLNEFLSSFRGWAGDANDIFRASAAETGGSRSLRFVQDATCQPTVTEVVVSPSNISDFWNTVADLQGQGYNRTDRIYLMFADANDLCGYGSLWPDDRPGANNANNQGPSYSRVDAGCWSGALAAHELMHNLGGVQNSSPHASGGFHCIDEYDVMCYSDYPNYPGMQVACSSQQEDERFDCGHDDYYSTGPAAGSYLDTHWNTANNRFLIGALDLPNAPGNASPPQVGVETKKHNGSASKVTVSATVNAGTDVQSMQFGVCTGGGSCSWDTARSIGEASATPYSVQWKLSKSGTFSFLAQAAYVDGSTAVSEPLTINHKAKKAKSRSRR